jgi:DNA-directed RNA polymerase subunit beta'
MRGLMSDPSGQILKLPIKKNFREGLTITDYLMSGYGARKGIVDTALKTANSGYLTRRLIDVSQDIIIREKNCLTLHTCFVFNIEVNNRIIKSIYEQILGRVLSKPIYNQKTNEKIADIDTQITPNLIRLFKQLSIKKFYIRSPLTCSLYRSVCQKCYGWDLANENLIDIGEAVGIIAGQSIGEPGTQLTMRTFHTGGIFTSEARQQIISSNNGIVKFSKIIKTLTLRTNRGEDVLLTKNSGYLVIIPEQKEEEIVQLELLPNTILFIKNNQYVKKGALLGELTKTEKQTKNEIKPVLSTTSGEIFMPHLKNKLNFINKNKLLWILSGQLYQAPFNSFLNFYTDYKINKNNYIFRTKLINQYSGSVNFINQKTNVFERNIEIICNNLIFKNSIIQRLTENKNLKHYLLKNNNFIHCINCQNNDSPFYFEKKLNGQFTSLVENCYKTETGGIPYFNSFVKNKSILSSKFLNYLKRIKNQDSTYSFGEFLFNHNSVPKNRLKVHLDSIIWLPEEVYKLNCDKSLLLVEHGSFISENFELIPGLFSKKSGIVIISQQNNIIQEICIKSGLVYQGKQFKNYANKIFYPGEIIFDNIKIETPVLCQHIIGKSIDQLLIRSLSIFEIARVKSVKHYLGDVLSFESVLHLRASRQYLFKSNQKIKTYKNIFLIKNVIDLNHENLKQKQLNLTFKAKNKTKIVQLILSENFSLINYIPAQLKYTNIESCLLVNQNQFVDSYTNLGYFENITGYK